MHHHLFKVLPHMSFSKALQELKKQGLCNHYVVKEATLTCIGGLFPQPPKDVSFSQELHLAKEIDWHEQARLHSPYYNEGIIEIPLKDFGFNTTKSVKLHPGEGFGDLSHATTKLMLEAMSQYLTPSCRILDIGSGSGILALSAHIALGSKALGLEIDPKALELSKKNAILSKVSSVEFASHISQQLFDSFSVILLNMIQAEQKQVFETYNLNSFKGVLIISGILSSEKETYLKQPFLSSCKLHCLLTYKEWVCFVFFKNPNS
jgi:ribosomal protein L11 methyltransferase